MVKSMEIGTVLKGRYRVLEKIGTGGMAEVYLAYDTVLDRKVAVKVMHPKYAADESFVTRFRREAQAAANLNHPNIVSVYDWGEEGGTYFIVMEHIVGDTLKALIKKRGALDITTAVDIAKQIARALAFAHKNGVVHRDIKPHNIIITHDGLAKVTDFGIARDKSSSLTDTGTVMGSVHYISPEQAQGLPATELSDIYSLGVMLYEMVTGNVPFEGDSAVSIALKHANEQPAPPSALNPRVSPELEAIILKAMAKDPFERYQTADEMLADLRRYEAGSSVEAAGGTFDKTVVLAPSEIKVPKRRFSLTAILATIAILILAGGAFAGIWIYQARLAASMTEVPKLVDLKVDVAQRLCEERGLTLKIDRYEFSELYAKDKIISQKPEDGLRVKKGTVIHVVVSKGEKPVEVPTLIGKSELQAGQLLGQLGLRIGSIDYAFSDTIPADTIMSQDPTPGVQVAKGTAVNIVISRGVEVVTIPDCEGLSLDQAKSLLAKAKLKYTVSEEYSSTIEKGKVIRQSPSPGDTAKKGESVLLVVSKGPSVVTIPDVVGKDSLSARKELEGLGLNVDMQNVELLDPDKVGKVVQQSPEPGQKVSAGSTVTIWVGQ
jgi:beta-lactam-binding protein with PASTA domain/tRNA A-37 threonylcarbamoyl transferase component Bud32